MAWYRPQYVKPDFSHLTRRTPEHAFAEAYAKPTFGTHVGRWPAAVNRQLIALFEGRERLHVDDAVEAYGKLFATERHTDVFTADRAGNALHWGVRLGVLQESVERGRYVWTMPDREPHWETDPKGHARQIRGLPDSAQAAMNRKRASQAKARTTIREREARSRDTAIEALVNDLLILRPDAVAPDAGICREVMPNAPLPQPIIAIRPMVLEAHHDLEPRQQRDWQCHLEAVVISARWEAKHRPALPVQPSPEEELSDEDAAALGDLG